MSSLVSDYQDALQVYCKCVSNISGDQWSGSTPCTEWNVRDLVNHLAYETAWVPDLFAGKTVEEVGTKYDGDVLGDDPVASVQGYSDKAASAVSAPGAMDVTCHLSFGDAPAAEYLNQIFLDTVIHTWDINKATGQDTEINPVHVDAIWEYVEPRQDQFAPSKYFAGPIEVPEYADKQAKLLALLGRQP